VAVEIPHRLQVLRALSALLETTSGESEIQTFNFKNSVFRGRGRFGDEVGQSDYMSILEAPRPDVGREGGENEASRHSTWDLLLQAWSHDDPDNPLDPMYFVAAAIEQTLCKIVAVKPGSGRPVFPTDYMLGNLVTSFSYGPGVVRPPMDGISSRVFLYMPLRVGIAEVV
jgi:hypothetical protein